MSGIEFAAYIENKYELFSPEVGSKGLLIFTGRLSQCNKSRTSKKMCEDEKKKK